MFHNSQVKVVVVPHFTELAASRIVELIGGNPMFMQYLPELKRTKKPLNRQYVYNVRPAAADRI